MTRFTDKDLLRRKGFTLVELSIVLVIIALVVAGVTGGKSLIRGAKIRSVIGEITEFQGAFNLFVDKYNNYPGDYAQAAEAAGDPFFNQGTNSGDGDGSVEWALVTADNVNEGIMAWQHLALEELIEGVFSGEDAVVADPGTTIPESKLAKDIGYAFNSSAALGNYIQLARENAAPPTTINDASAISSPDAAKIDNKLDDGNPSMGIVQATGANCVDDNMTAMDATDDLYDVQDKTVHDLECVMTIRMN